MLDYWWSETVFRSWYLNNIQYCMGAILTHGFLYLLDILFLKAIFFLFEEFFQKFCMVSIQERFVLKSGDDGVHTVDELALIRMACDTLTLFSLF